MWDTGVWKDEPLQILRAYHCGVGDVWVAHAKVVTPFKYLSLEYNENRELVT